jgi:hypothetical protein
MTLIVGHGTLSLGTQTGLTVSGTGTAASPLTLSGTLSALNGDLPTLVYSPTSGYSSSDTLNASVLDTTDEAQGTSQQVAITVNPLPAVKVPAAISVNENGSFTFTGGNAISVIDTAGTGNNNETMTLIVGHGTLSLGTQTGLTVSGTGTAASPLTLSGTLSALNGDLPTLVYSPTSGYSSSDTLNASVLDTTDEAQGSPQKVAISVNPVNQSPTVTVVSPVSVNENASLVFCAANGNAITLTDPAVAGTSDSLTLKLSEGTLTLGSTSELTFTSGQNDTASMTLTGTLASLQAALNGLVFTPGKSFCGSASFVITLKDSGDKMSGSATVTITINPLKPPSVTVVSPVSVNENTSLTFSMANKNAIALTDADASGTSDSLSLTVTHGTLTLGSTSGLSFTSGCNSSASMTVRGTLANLSAAVSGLKFTPSMAYRGSASLVITLKDSGDNVSGSATVTIAVMAPASTPTVTVKTLLTTAVPGEPVPLVIAVSDSNAGVQAAAFTFAVSFGDGHSTSFTSKSPLVLNHVYTKTGTFTFCVTATDEYGHASKAATVVIRVCSVAVETNPFNTSQMALFVGGTTGNDTVSFAACGKNIAVTLDGVSEGVFSASGPLIIMGQGGKDTFHEGSGLKNTVDLLESANADNLETDLDNESLQWAGLNAAMEILNA